MEVRKRGEMYWGELSSAHRMSLSETPGADAACVDLTRSCAEKTPSQAI